MNPVYWQKQDPATPLYPDILWEKPERRDLAGKLLIVGGSGGGIHDIAQSYEAAKDAGIGELRILVPECLKPITRQIEGIDFLPATKTGNFAHNASDQLLFTAGQIGAVLLPGNIGRNSETAMLLADLLRSYSGKLSITKDAVDALYGEANNLLKHPDTLLVVSFAQLQRLAKEVKSPVIFRSDLDFLILIERLHEFSLQCSAMIVTKHHNQMLFACNGKVVTTERKDLNELWCVDVASKAMVFWTQHPNVAFNAITTSLIP